MDVLVIGGGGQVGSELCNLLQQEDINFYAPSRDQLNLEDHREVRRLITDWRPEVVINTAGYRANKHANVEPSLCFRMNRDCVSNLADACQQAGAALIHISSWRVFDGLKKDAYTEKDTPNPKGVLGSSFWLGEQQIHQRCPRHIILRLSWIISQKGNNRLTKLLTSFADDGKPAELSTNRGCPTSTQDVARVLMAITKQVQCKINVWGTYHYSASEPVTEIAFAEDVVAEAARFTRIPDSQKSVLTEEDPVTNAHLDSTLAQHTFGIRPHPWRTYLPALVRDFYEPEKES